MTDLLACRDHDTGRLIAYVFPGGYPVMYVTNDGDILCADCATRQEDEGADDGDAIAGAEIHWEGDIEICADCGKRIASAYGADVDDVVTWKGDEYNRLDAGYIGACLSSGTLRTEDLFERFRLLLPASLRMEFDCAAEESPERLEVLDEAFEFLNAIAPQGCVFESSEGDGACFGFWSFDETPR